MAGQYRIKSAFQSPLDEFDGSGKRPVVFDIIGPDRVTSLLPPGLKMVLHVNPQSMSFTYAKTISRQQTMRGFVEYHWGSNPTEISFTMATGGFIRLYSGLSNVTGPTPSNDRLPPNMRAISTGGTRRETIAYDKYLDLLALFHNNGSIYDSRGNIAYQGQILITYDGGSWWGWFSNFGVEESVEKPYQFTLNASFTVDRELHRTKSVYIPREIRTAPTTNPSPTQPATQLPNQTPQGQNTTPPSPTPQQQAAASSGSVTLEQWTQEIRNIPQIDLIDIQSRVQAQVQANQSIPRPPNRR